MADSGYKIHVSNLKKNFGKLEVLRDISLDVSEGEVVVLIGPSGSGKSTLLRCLNQLETATGGQIIIDGHDVTDKHTDINKVRQNIGMVFQHFNLFNHLNVMDNMTLAPVHLKLMTKEQAREEAMRLLRRVGLEDKAEAYPSQLSGGQKQRVAIARMLMQKAPVMVFDDSLSAVDAETDVKIRAALKESMGKSTVILISHRVTTLMQADCIMVLDKGRIAEMGTHEELMARHGVYRKIYDIQMNLDEETLKRGGAVCE